MRDFDSKKSEMKHTSPRFILCCGCLVAFTNHHNPFIPILGCGFYAKELLTVH